MIGNPHRAQIVKFELFELKFLNSKLFELILLLKLDAVPCPAIRGNNISVSSTLPPSYEQPRGSVGRLSCGYPLFRGAPISSFSRCSDAEFWRKFGEILANFQPDSGETCQTTGNPHTNITQPGNIYMRNLLGWLETRLAQLH